MPSHFVARYPNNYKPGEDFLDSPENRHTMRIGVIQRVDPINLRADIKILTGDAQRVEIELTQGLCGPRSFWGGVPEVGSLVLLGHRITNHKHQQSVAVILGYLPVGNRIALKFDPLAPSNPEGVAPDDAATYQALFGSAVRHKRLKLEPGDVGGMSSSGAEFVLNKSVSMVNRAGDLFELREDERTLVSQAVHRFENDAGVARYSGPVRRQAFWLPSEIMTGEEGARVLKTEKEGYAGRDDLQRVGPGAVDASTKFANSSGALLEEFNNETLYPSVTYANGKKVFYPSAVANVSLESPPRDGGGTAYTESRLEMFHDTDLVPEVRAEIDGFTANPRKVFLEQVMGTVFGNDPYSTEGIRQYGQALQPKIWSNATSMAASRFSLEVINRTSNGDQDILTSAAAYLFRINPVVSKDDGLPFVVAVQKQGKLLIQVPKPSNESYGDSVKGVSAEANLLGALKLFLGAASPSNTSLFAKLQGGIKAEIGRNTDTGNSLDIVYTGPVRHEYVGATDAQGNGLSSRVTGHCSTTVSGDKNFQTGGAFNIVANGPVVHKADKIVHHGISGYTINSAGFQKTVTGMTYMTYAQLKTETIASGGHIKTILAGALVENIAAGAKTTTTGGAVSVTAGAAITEQAGGAYSTTAGAAITHNAGAAYSITAGAAVSITAGAAMTLTAPSLMVSAADIMLGTGAPLGVVRATPALPPGTPTLDYITGLPLLGCAVVRSL